MIKQGQNIFFVFRDGEAVLDSQGKPYMYKSVKTFERWFQWHGKKEPVELVEYVPKGVTRYDKN